MTKRFDKNDVIPNRRVRFNFPLLENPQVQHDENPLLNRVQGGSRIPLPWNASEQRQKANPSVRAGVIPLRWRGDREVGVVSMKKRSAFTLAEVLITLGIIGVVSAMTIPNLVSNYQYKALDTKKTLFQERLYEAMNQMRFHEKLTGYSDAEDFVAELGKYLKINETCDLTDMTDCFPDVAISSCDEKVYVEDLKTGEDFAADILNRDFTSDNVGIVLADGTKAIINYDLDCEWLDPYESGLNRTEATQCIAIIADMNGNAGKNMVGSDIIALNSSLGVNIEGLDACWDTSDTPITALNTCGGDVSWDYTFTTTAQNAWLADSSVNGTPDCSKNYWAGALKACSDAGKSLPTLSELAYLTQYLYDLDYVPAETGTVSSIVFNETKGNELSMTFSGSGAGASRYWSNQSTSNLTAYHKFFRADNAYVDGNASSDSSYSDNLKSYSSVNARCVKD
ncbi:MAG: type II secretion system protein [Candidatus Gastranaerophilales bacterium]